MPNTEDFPQPTKVWRQGLDLNHGTTSQRLTWAASSLGHDTGVLLFVVRHSLSQGHFQLTLSLEPIHQVCYLSFVMSASVIFAAHPPWPETSLMVCKELLQLWEQPGQVGNDDPAEHMAGLGIQIWASFSRS